SNPVGKRGGVDSNTSGKNIFPCKGGLAVITANSFFKPCCIICCVYNIDDRACGNINADKRKIIAGIEPSVNIISAHIDAGGFCNVAGHNPGKRINGEVRPVSSVNFFQLIYPCIFPEPVKGGISTTVPEGGYIIGE